MTPKKLGMVILCALVTASCATINPYVLPYEPTPKDIDEKKPPRTCTDSEHSSVCKLRQFQAELGRKLKEHTVTGAVSGSLLMPLASIIAYKGATGAGTHNIAALSAGGFSGYGTTQYLYKRPRELIYVSGISALDCAIRVSQPYLWEESKKSTAARVEATGAVNSLKSQAKDFNDHYFSGLPTPLEQEFLSTGDLLSARLELARAYAAQRRALSDQYEAEMVAAAYRVVAEVNKQLALLAPDPESLQSKLGGLALPAAAPAAPAKPDGLKAAPPGGGLSRSISDKHANDLNREIANYPKRQHELEKQSRKLSRRIEDETRRTESAELLRNKSSNEPSVSRGYRKDAERHRSSALDYRKKKDEIELQITDLAASMDAKERERDALEALIQKRDQVEMLVRSVEEDTPPEVRPPNLIDYTECGINQPSGLIETALEAHPDTIKIAKSANATIYITGGIGTVSASVVSHPPGEPSEALTISVKQLGSGMAEISLVTTDKFEAGSHAILTRDAAGGVKLVPVQGQ